MSSRKSDHPQLKASDIRSRFQEKQDLLEEDLMHQTSTELTGPSLTPDRVMQLQRTVGNRAVNRLLKTRKQKLPIIQRSPITNKLAEYVRDEVYGEEINNLAHHILKAIMAIDSKNWRRAHYLLHDSEMATEVGYTLNLKQEMINSETDDVDAMIEAAIGKGMHYKDTMTLDLPDVAIIDGDIEFHDDEAMYNAQFRTPKNDAELAMRILPVVLEEWIHLFQSKIGGYLSKATYLFAGTDEVIENQALDEGPERWNLNEVDIYAVYQDLGWDEVLDAFRARYQERQSFADFHAASDAE